MTRVSAVVVQSESVDSRLPGGEILVQVLDDGQVHVAFREHPWQVWPVGAWATFPEALQRET